MPLLSNTLINSIRIILLQNLIISRINNIYLRFLLVDQSYSVLILRNTDFLRVVRVLNTLLFQLNGVGLQVISNSSHVLYKLFFFVEFLVSFNIRLRVNLDLICFFATLALTSFVILSTATFLLVW